jgi:hypothetical protein
VHRACIRIGVAIFNVLIKPWIIPVHSWRGAVRGSIASDVALACATETAAFELFRQLLEVDARPVAPTTAATRI